MPSDSPTDPTVDSSTDSPTDSPVDPPTDSPADSPVDPTVDSSEDRAQASARSEIVPEDELPERPGSDGTGTVIKPPEDDDQPSLDELREELNSQFESIKVVEPGQYELNLMELYERDEYIIAMRENGRYVIQVPDSWTGPVDS
ncbi:Zn-ribbon containing protein [Haladaptatus sp. R4]|uniref:OapC/ArvC family zinc-ribbon domain-containing protein n=1 Tax=Haladaptatus sp. R4 TaxID=1679489 RepID=UPI0037435AF3